MDSKNSFAALCLEDSSAANNAASLMFFCSFLISMSLFCFKLRFYIKRIFINLSIVSLVRELRIQKRNKKCSKWIYLVLQFRHFLVQKLVCLLQTFDKTSWKSWTVRTRWTWPSRVWWYWSRIERWSWRWSWSYRKLQTILNGTCCTWKCHLFHLCNRWNLRSWHHGRISELIISPHF